MPEGRILIVEDEGIVAMDLEACLRHMGYEVTGTCASADEAMASAAKEPPDLVLMDIHIHGEVDGIETARLLQGQAGTPVVFLTAYADDETLSRARLVGPYGYLVKPYEEQTLRTTIEVTLSKARSDAEDSKRRELMASLLDDVPEGILVVDKQGRIIYGNDSAEVRLGRPDVEGAPLGEVWPEGATPSAQRLLEGADHEQSHQVHWPDGACAVSLTPMQAPFDAALLVISDPGARSARQLKERLAQRLHELV